ncbi:hypothetical protein PG989_010794 [Apiospora arundinis]
MFGHLPRELQLQILKLCPSLESLWSLVQASPSMSVVLDGYSLEIVDTVLDQTVPVQTRRLMRAVLRAKASAFPASLSETRTIATMDPAPWTEFPSGSAQGKVVRSFLATVDNTHTWSHACLDHLIRRSLELRPLTLVALGSGWTPLEQFQAAERQDEQYQPPSTGPPSWVEEQRMIKAFWRLQFFLELQSAGARGRLGEQENKDEDLDEDLEREGWSWQDLYILSSSIGEFHELFGFEQQQLLTAYDFFLSVASQISAATSTSFEITRREDSYGLPIITKTVTESSPAVSCAEQPSFGSREDTFHQGPEYLDREPTSYEFNDFMSNRDLRGSPLLGVPFEPYRKFGFAIWDDQRMADLGFRAPGPSSIFKNRRFYYFRWHSILPEEVSI